MGTQHDTPRKKSKQDLFLEAFAVHGNVSAACRSAAIERKTFYRWKEGKAFLARYEAALEEAKDNIRAEIYRRAHDGVEEPMVSNGQVVYDYDPVIDEATGEQKKDEKGKLVWQRGAMMTTRKYSDTLLIFHAKMLMPEYRDKSTLVVQQLPKEYVGYDPNEDGVEP